MAPRQPTRDEPKGFEKPSVADSECAAGFHQHTRVAAPYVSWAVGMLRWHLGSLHATNTKVSKNYRGRWRVRGRVPPACPRSCPLYILGGRYTLAISYIGLYYETRTLKNYLAG
jgi:hypothetical protein